MTPAFFMRVNHFSPPFSPMPRALSILGEKVRARDVTIEQGKNRTAQVLENTGLLQAKLDEAAANAIRLQGLTDEAKADSARIAGELKVAKAAAAETQILLDKARLISTDFQMQMKQAKVASLKRQGEVEVARTETTVAQKRLEKAETDFAQLEVKFADAKKWPRAGGKAGQEQKRSGPAAKIRSKEISGSGANRSRTRDGGARRGLPAIQPGAVSALCLYRSGPMMGRIVSGPR